MQSAISFVSSSAIVIISRSWKPALLFLMLHSPRLGALVPSISTFFVLKWIIIVYRTFFLLSSHDSALSTALRASVPVSVATFPARFAEVLVPVSDVAAPTVFSGPLSAEGSRDLATTVFSAAPSVLHPSVLPCEYQPTYNIQVFK